MELPKAPHGGHITGATITAYWSERTGRMMVYKTADPAQFKGWEWNRLFLYVVDLVEGDVRPQTAYLTINHEADGEWSYHYSSRTGWTDVGEGPAEVPK